MEIAQGTEKAVGKKGKGPKRPKAGEASGDRNSAGKKQFEIDIFRGWCKCCGICAAFCPKGCISLDLDGTPNVSDSGQCVGCGWCELHCPDFAISVREKNSEKSPESGSRE